MKAFALATWIGLAVLIHAPATTTAATEPAPPPAVKHVAGPAPREVRLPGRIHAITEASGGRLLVISFEGRSTLSVFDMKEGNIVQEVAVSEPAPTIAGGRDKLIVGLSKSNSIERWDLATFKREASTRAPADTHFAAEPGTWPAEIRMGCDSAGPFVITGGGDKLKVFDLSRLEQTGSVYTGSLIADQVRLAADGTLLAQWSKGTDPSGIFLRAFPGSAIAPALGPEEKQHFRRYGISAGNLVPSDDGTLLATSGGFVFQSLNCNVPLLMDPTAMFLPVHGRSLILGIKDGQLTFYAAAGLLPILTFDGFDELKIVRSPLMTSLSDDPPIDQRIHYMPAFSRMVTTPATNDRLLVRTLDLPAELKKAAVPYLFLDAPLPALAITGKAVTAKLTAQSSDPNVTFALDSGPQGMTLSSTGALSWPLPAPPAAKGVGKPRGPGQAAFDAPANWIQPTGQPGPDAPALPVSLIVTNGQGLKRPMTFRLPVVPAGTPGAAGREPESIPLPGRTEASLPAAADSVVCGGGGRYLVFRIPERNELAVFDADTGIIAREIPVDAAHCRYAAGMSKLYVINYRHGRIDRWDLATMKPDRGIDYPFTERVTLAAMGSESEGPLLIVDATHSVALDGNSLQPLKIAGLDSLGEDGFDPRLCFSADGHCFGLHSNMRVSFFDLTGPQLKEWSIPSGNMASGGIESFIRPNHDGGYICTGERVFQFPFEQSTPQRAAPPPPPGHVGIADQPHSPVFDDDVARGQFIPVDHANLCLWIAYPNSDARNAIYTMTGLQRLIPLPLLPELSMRAANSTPSAAKVPIDQRLWYRARAGRLVTIGMDDKTIVARRLNVTELLRQADMDFLYVASAPITRYVPGRDYADSLDIRSNAQGIHCELARGPVGMTITDTGTLAWHAPESPSPTEIPIHVVVKNGAGRTYDYEYQLIPPGMWPEPRSAHPRAPRPR